MEMARIGLIGLGTMGAALALNIAEKGFPVAVYNRTASATEAFAEHAGSLRDRITPARSVKALVAALDRPRAVIVMVKAGEAVDAVIKTLRPLLDKDDLIIDAGNADFNDTRRREAALAKTGINFIGMGVSGGEDGARHGPSIMVGGPENSFEPIREIVEAIAARYQDKPCAAWLGPDGAGHFVKTLHNGIEYADMQLIAEVWGILRDGQGRSAAAAAELFAEWNRGPLQSFLVEITAEVLAASDPVGGGPMVAAILDKAGQKGTGRWTVIEALKLGQSASTIEAAVGARSWSARKPARERGATIFSDTGLHCRPVLDGELEEALLAARIIAYGQGFSVLSAASREFAWSLDLARIAEIWRAGCIIRSAMLDDIATAVRDGLPEGELMFSGRFAKRLREYAPSLRRVTVAATQGGLPVPGLAAALSYFDTMRQGRGTTDLIQAQRDFFGAHGFERVDGVEEPHGPWHR